MDKTKRLVEFAYPEEIITVVSAFAEIVNEVFNKQKSGVLLVGSTARGELCWEYINNQLEMYSDIEFLVAVDYKNNHLINDFRKRVTELELSCIYGKAFHLDYTIIPWPKVKKVDKKFFVFESKQCGIDVGNNSVAAHLPVVDRTNLNWKELNEVVLHRMNSMLHAVPISLFDSAMLEKEQRTFALNLAKNTLDLTTWLHPYESDELTAGFSARTKFWDKDFLKKSQFGDYFSEEDIEYIRYCLTLRKKTSIQVDTTFMLGQTLSLYSKGISYCKAMNGIDKNERISHVLPSIKLFDEYRFRQRVSQGISLLINLTKTGVVKCLKNMLWVRKGVAISYSNYMLLAAYDHIRDKNNGQCNLNKARVELLKLTRYNEIEGDGFVGSWVNLRDYFKKYQTISHNF